jgi:hypothetical protein
MDGVGARLGQIKELVHPECPFRRFIQDGQFRKTTGLSPREYRLRLGVE